MSTASVEPLFTVKETGDGTPFLYLEHRGEASPGFPSSVVLRLRDGTTLEEARELSKLMASRIVRLSITA
ncbi:hypothetical protein [Aquincola sp. J276]|uniref:hypothetical protein n=1 Tax=Aquincola sp. J276 TaxID=2898432 RepID=UPI002150BEAF|nr:hypothetical protein [Aquincola sp. J276]MCR5865218.1 hypothetical protein [Aquincola sp. J276]